MEKIKNVNITPEFVDSNHFTKRLNEDLDKASQIHKQSYLDRKYLKMFYVVNESLTTSYGFLLKKKVQIRVRLNYVRERLFSKEFLEYQQIVLTESFEALTPKEYSIYEHLYSKIIKSLVEIFAQINDELSYAITKMKEEIKNEYEGLDDPVEKGIAKASFKINKK